MQTIFSIPIILTAPILQYYTMHYGITQLLQNVKYSYIVLNDLIINQIALQQVAIMVKALSSVTDQAEQLANGSQAICLKSQPTMLNLLELNSLE